MPQVQPQVAVLGVTGYAGAELARLLLRHPRLAGTAPLFLGREGSARESLTAIHPQLAGLTPEQLCVEPFSWELLASRGVKVIFLATPHEQSRRLVPEALARGLRIVDLSGAWRLDNQTNRAVYKFADEGSPTAVKTQSRSIYGMPELHRTAIAEAQLVANPGCYATTIILALKPLIAAEWVDLDRGIVCDAKSGVSGAGKEPTAKTHFMYAADNLSAYGLFGHRHTGELLEQLEVSADSITFTPHLLPIPRGILATIYVTFREKRTAEEIETCLRGFYIESPMVRVHSANHLPQIQHVVRTNFCDLGFHIAPDGRRCIVISCLDNLLKGAAGQAVQNLNVMNGWQETEGLL
jgi:N-acetyl-gamma-glutamyl-phosphate reductase